MSGLPDYSTGGTIHLVVNNQVGSFLYVEGWRFGLAYWRAGVLEGCWEGVGRAAGLLDWGNIHLLGVFGVGWGRGVVFPGRESFVDWGDRGWPLPPDGRAACTCGCVDCCPQPTTQPRARACASRMVRSALPPGLGVRGSGQSVPFNRPWPAHPAQSAPGQTIPGQNHPVVKQPWSNRPVKPPPGGVHDRPPQVAVLPLLHRRGQGPQLPHLPRQRGRRGGGGERL